MPSITTCRVCGADCWTPPEDCAPLCAACVKKYGSLYDRCPRCGGWGVLEPSGFCSFVCKDLYEAFCEAVSRYDY